MPANRTRLIVRYRGMVFISPAVHAIAPDAGPVPRLIRFAVLHVPGVDLLARGLDFFVGDPLHHYMETGLLNGIKQRTEGTFAHAGSQEPSHPGSPPTAAVEPVATGE